MYVLELILLRQERKMNINVRVSMSQYIHTNANMADFIDEYVYCVYVKKSK